MTKGGIVSGGIGMALIAALGTAAPSMWNSYLTHKREMFALQQSQQQSGFRELCADAGGKWWKGDCLEVHE